MLSHCFVCTASSPLATWTSHCAPTSLQRCSTSALSRCQRSSFNVSIENPMRTGPPDLAPQLVFPDSGPFTQAERKRRQTVTNNNDFDGFIVRFLCRFATQQAPSGAACL